MVLLLCSSLNMSIKKQNIMNVVWLVLGKMVDARQGVFRRPIICRDD